MGCGVHGVRPRRGRRWPGALVLAAGLAGAARAEGEDVLGTWQGSYTCSQGETALVLTLRAGRDGNGVEGLFHFRPAPGNPGVPEGCFAMRGTYDGTTREVRLTAGPWLLRPDGYVSVDLRGRVDPDGGRLGGEVLGPWCTVFAVRRTSLRPAGVPAACRGEAAVAVLVPDGQGLRP